MYKLFIDDERMPVDDTWIIAREAKSVYEIVNEYGMPYMISFDHDLGYNQLTGYDIAKWLGKKLIADTRHKMFDYVVHSQNPIGKQNIEGYLENLVKFVEPEQLEQEIRDCYIIPCKESNMWLKAEDCDGVEISAPGGGVKCTECGGWFYF